VVMPRGGRSKAMRLTGRSTTERGYGYAWQKVRRRVLARDKGLCQSCMKSGRVRQATEVDHIVRKADGGGDAPDNLQSLCTLCHEAKTRDENRGHSIGCHPDGTPLTPNPYWR
jgi:5-methylcytosine-specific restriction protein A